MHALQTQPTVSATLVHHIQRGNIVIKPNIKVTLNLLQTSYISTSKCCHRSVLCSLEIHREWSGV